MKRKSFQPLSQTHLGISVTLWARLFIFSSLSIYKTGIRLSGPREVHGREYRKNVRASGNRGESPEMLTSGYDIANAYINSRQLWLPAHDQARQNSNMNRGGAFKAWILAEELWAAGGCWVGKNISSLEKWPRADGSCLGGWSHIHVHMGSTICTKEIINNKKIFLRVHEAVRKDWWHCGNWR